MPHPLRGALKQGAAAGAGGCREGVQNLEQPRAESQEEEGFWTEQRGFQVLGGGGGAEPDQRLAPVVNATLAVHLLLELGLNSNYVTSSIGGM